MTILNLKKLCRERGIKLSGSKDEVIIRLMEDDEERNSSPQKRVSVVNNVNQGTQVSLGQSGHVLPLIIGLGIIIYGFFRIGIALLFSLDSNDNFLFLQSIVAWLIGMIFISSGIIVMMGYRNGLIIAISNLGISGILSLILHYEEFSPLSLGLGGEIPFLWSLFCSSACLLMTSLPLIIAGEFLNSGWPPSIQRVIDNFNDVPADKFSIECSECNLKLLIPIEYSGKIKCPECDYEMSV